jgi:hypothetical protein
LPYRKGVKRHEVLLLVGTIDPKGKKRTASLACSRTLENVEFGMDIYRVVLP